jgi:hypothetical protein
LSYLGSSAFIINCIYIITIAASLYITIASHEPCHIMDTVRIYFDTNLVQFGSYMLIDSEFDDYYIAKPARSFLTKLGHKEKLQRDLKALRFILDKDDDLPFIFTTSNLTKLELSRIPELSKRERSLEFCDLLLNYGNPNNWPSPINVPAKPNKCMLERISSILRQSPHYNENDTRHIYQSLIKKCNIFLTSDWKTILKYQSDLENLGVHAKSPYQLVTGIYGKALWGQGAGLLLR